MKAETQGVLIVDDDVTHGKMLVDVLREEGWNASATTGVNEAIARLQNDRFSAIVSDVRMGREDGFDLLRAIRASEHPLPVILMSSFGTEDLSRKALEAGAFAYLPKPFPMDELLVLLERARGSTGACT